MDHTPYLFPSGGQARLSDFVTRARDIPQDKDDGQRLLSEGISRLSEMQEKLYASDRHSVLIIFQAMDAAGKDGTIRHVMSGINPQGCQVTSFKAPSAEELDHTYLWRCMKALPERGRIGIFNRSYYEEVLVVRVHPGILAGQKLPNPPDPGDQGFWNSRFRQINDFERYLSENGMSIIKFFLHVSREEQKQRFLERIEDPSRHWKFSAGDVKERQHWDRYMAAYDDMLRHTSTPWAPWYVIPADKKWYMRALVADILVDRFNALKLEFPTADEAQRLALKEAENQLRKET
ncbi:MAG TPA: polyphosphate kinase 2 family protein [Bacteroidales bacterium]|nr:polyphosphate kinase 2 family protein [Bacteroidales bacterium]HRZ77639.1 polyphosphate kinase 2 family protein [Bacteroidales bacterium]